jgi:cobalt-zinc-cadmium efflux system membrane fusion protein
VNYNENEMARITPLASGVIQRVLANIGDKVEAGDVLVEVNSAEIAEAKAAYLAAIADVRVKELASKREEKLVKEKISAAREFQEAKARYDIAFLTQCTAHQRLLNYGFTENEIKQIEQAHDSSSSFAVRAPFNGTLVTREAVIGEVVSPGDALFTLANLNSMWLELSIPASQAGFVEQDLDVEASFDIRAGVVTKGNLFWVATSIDERSRMLKARANIPNADGKIKAGMFGKAKIKTDQASKAYSIPRDAIQRLEGNPYLFVKEGEDLLALRRVVLGNVNDSRIDVLSGVNESDQIVVQGSFIAMSEFLKSRLGAGCTDD